MGDAGERREPRARRRQIGRPLTVVDHQAKRPAAGGKPADDVGVDLTVYPRRDSLSRNHVDFTAFHARVVSCT